MPPQPSATTQVCVHAEAAHHHPSCCPACTPHHTHAPTLSVPALSARTEHLPMPPSLPAPLPSPADLIGDTAVILAKERIVPDVIDNISDKAAFKVRAERVGTAAAAAAACRLSTRAFAGTCKRGHCAQLQAAAACILLALSCTATA